MSAEINRDGTINAIKWLAEEQPDNDKKSEIRKLSVENIKLKMKIEKQKCLALGEMYRVVARCAEEYNCPSYEKRICHYAEAMVQLCYKTKIIDLDTHNTLQKYIEHCMKRIDLADKEKTKED